MRTIGRLFVGVLGVASSLAAFSQPAAAQGQVLPLLDHIHLAVPDPAKGVEWYQKNFDGQPITSEGVDRLMFGQTRLIFLRNDKAQPSSGSAVDHIGFSFTDLDAKVKALEAAGAKVVTPARDIPGLPKLGFIEDPWGTRIEVMQDPETLGLHHVHLRAPDATAALAWYKEKFGGQTMKFKDRIDALKYGSVWLLVQAGAATPSEGHAVDHIGFRTTNLDGTIATLKSQTVKVTTEPREITLPSGTKMRISYVEGPAVARIEIVQR